MSPRETPCDEQKEKRPLVTFALFAYNQERFIREAVEGAFSQTYEPLEIILSDDCSSDRTFEIMQEMADAYDGPHEVQVRRNTSNCKLAAHINAVIREIETDIVVWAAGDDISLPHRVNLAVQQFLKDPNIVGVHSPVITMSETGELGEEWIREDISDRLLLSDIIVGRGVVVSQSHAFRMIVFNKFGPFHDGLTNEGAPMAFRELLLGELFLISEPCVYYRIGSGTSTYQGGNWRREKYSEPLKITGWRLSGLVQIRDDLEIFKMFSSCSVISYDKLVEVVLTEIKYFELLMRINTRNYDVSSLYKLVVMGRGNREVIRAFLRYNCPDIIYKNLNILGKIPRIYKIENKRRN